MLVIKIRTLFRMLPALLLNRNPLHQISSVITILIPKPLHITRNKSICEPAQMGTIHARPALNHFKLDPPRLLVKTKMPRFSPGISQTKKFTPLFYLIRTALCQISPVTSWQNRNLMKRL